jgi:hypothetical protein
VTFILSPERDSDPAGAFKRYRDYLEREDARFPRQALALALSDWYFDATDHRSPHDAWLEAALFEESGSGTRQEERTLSLRLTLLGAYRDLKLEFWYPKVFRYEFRGAAVSRGHFDWRYDEFRVSDAGRLVHDIQWSGVTASASWLIEAEDVSMTWSTLEAR